MKVDYEKTSAPAASDKRGVASRSLSLFPFCAAAAAAVAADGVCLTMGLLKKICAAKRKLTHSRLLLIIKHNSVELFLTAMGVLAKYYSFINIFLLYYQYYSPFFLFDEHIHKNFVVQLLNSSIYIPTDKYTMLEHKY